MEKNKIPLIRKWKETGLAQYPLEMQGFISIKDVERELKTLLRNATSVQEVKAGLFGEGGIDERKV